MQSIDLKNCRVFFYDGTLPTPEYVEVLMDEGNIQWTKKRNLQVKREQGRLGYIKEGDQENLTVQMDCRFDAVKSSIGDPATVEEILTNKYSDFSSTSDCGKTYTIHIEVLNDNGDCDIEAELYRFTNFALEELQGSFKDGTLSISGLCDTVDINAQRGTT